MQPLLQRAARPRLQGTQAAQLHGCLSSWKQFWSYMDILLRFGNMGWCAQMCLFTLFILMCMFGIFKYKPINLKITEVKVDRWSLYLDPTLSMTSSPCLTLHNNCKHRDNNTLVCVTVMGHLWFNWTHLNVKIWLFSIRDSPGPRKLLGRHLSHFGFLQVRHQARQLKSSAPSPEQSNPKSSGSWGIYLQIILE